MNIVDPERMWTWIQTCHHMHTPSWITFHFLVWYNHMFPSYLEAGSLLFLSYDSSNHSFFTIRPFFAACTCKRKISVYCACIYIFILTFHFVKFWCTTKRTTKKKCKQRSCDGHVTIYCGSHEMSWVCFPVWLVLCSHLQGLVPQFPPQGVLETTQTEHDPFLKL